MISPKPQFDLDAHISHGRLLKASTLAAILAAHNYRAATVSTFTDEHWALVCAAGRIKSGKASDTTRALGIALLREREEGGRVLEMKRR
jgi:hypothetical protein